MRLSFRNRFSSLRTKVLFTIVLFLSVMVGLASYLSYQFWERELIRLTERQLTLTARSVELSVGLAMQQERHQEVGEILRQVAGKEGILSARIYGEGGLIRRSSNPAEEGTRVRNLGPHADIEARIPLGQLGASEEGSLRVMSPIANRPQCHRCHGPDARINGVLELNISLAPALQVIAENRQKVILFAAASILLLSLAVVLLFEREVKAPISAVLAAMREVERGDLSLRIATTSRDEIGRVAQGLNSMVERLQRAIGEIRRYHAEELEKSRRLAALGELAASVAHEIGNPLAGVRAAVQVIRASPGLEESDRAILDEVLAQIDRLHGTVKDLLDFARPRPPQKVPVDLHPILERVLAVVADQCARAGVTIIRQYALALGPVPVDVALFEQAVLNIVLNAIQAMPTAGTLRIRTAEEGGAATVTVADTGEGIPREYLDRIFTPFFTTKQRGTGLGLAITRAVVEAHGGTVLVESEVGVGTSMTLRLPMDAGAQGAGGETA